MGNMAGENSFLSGALKRFRPGLIVRLGNLIVVQIIFVFATLTIVLFYPYEQKHHNGDYPQLKERFSDATSRMASAIRSNSVGNGQHLPEPELDRIMKSGLGNDNLIQGYLYLQTGDGTISRAYTMCDSIQLDADLRAREEISDLIDIRVISYEMGAGEELLIPHLRGAHYQAYYYPFLIEKDQPAVLVAIFDHRYITFQKNQMAYTLFVLFLASTLVSLLIVSMLYNRLKVPLARLTRGFEKTTDGELYYLLETDGDEELSKLSTAFNAMSKTLWDNHQQLRAYNEKLESANQALTQSQQSLSTMIENSPECIISAGSDGTIRVFNRKAAAVFNLSHDDALGRSINDLFTHPPDEITSTRSKDDEGMVEVLCRRNDGSLFPACMTMSPVEIGDDGEQAWLYIIKDISASQSFQEMMIRLDRYSTRGQMAGDIAHEINNFLAILSGNVELMPLFLKRGDNEKIEKKLELMRTTIFRISRFCDGLMDANEGEVRFEKVDVNQLTENVLAFLKPQNPFDEVEIETDLSTEIPLVELDIGQIQQLLVNFVYNAGEALGDCETDRKMIRIISRPDELNNEPAVRIAIHDNGPGVREDKLALLFEKRFTTKRKGHGIGLMTCRRIADAHNGAVGYSFDEGGCFHLILPVEQRLEIPSEVDTDATRTTVRPV